MMRRYQRCREGENPSRTCKLPVGGAVLLVLVGLLAAALIIICSLSFDKMRTNQTIQTLKEENEALRKNISDLTRLKCEPGWEKHGGNCYYFSTTESSWINSRSSCVDRGSDLVKIDSREEQMFLVGRLRNLMEDDEDKFWIGLRDLVEEGKWFWVDGSPLDESLTFWMDEEPNNISKDGAASADCGRMGMKNKHDDLKSWFDISCNYPQKSICEKTAG
ncbi:C-type lectin domain family 4 member E-like [Gambusia affinis]|uniref:C-type lectin domain family 4 member E-like n=1 Tax=Gambusia affinis TaxID=33528 RepID=UPI001CDD68A0|nr:C-type lectin domain family 4 member E-like [Gambusia affinis]XP_043994219.1 C-type lectin domain family 4 member E-like [Gambusia affinis]